MRSCNKSPFLLLVVTFFCLQVYAQDRQQLFDEFIESIEKNLDEEAQAEEIVNYYLNIFDNPILLNSCTSEDLKSLNILTKEEVKIIIDYRNKTSPFHSLYELISIINLDKTRFSYLFPFVEVGSEKKPIGKNHLDMIGGFKTVVNSEKSQNIESNLSGYRYKIKGDFNKLRFGLALKKDSGEPLRWSPINQWYLFEHSVGFIEVRNLWKLEKTILGNFTLGNGSGLIFSNGRINSKTVNPIQFGNQPDVGTKSFASFLENSAFKGITSTIQLYRLKITPFVSLRFLNGTVNKNSIERISESTNINTSNLINQRKKVQVMESGFSMISLFKELPITIGLNFISTLFKYPITLERNYYAQRTPQRSNYAGSLFLKGQWKGIYLWSELAINDQLAKNLIMGLNFSLGQKSDMTLSYRSFSDGFFSFHSNPGSHFGNHLNEEGYYFALRINPLKDLSINAYSDIIRSSKLRYQTPTPSTLTDSRISIIHNFNKEHHVSIWVRKQQKTMKESSSNPLAKHLKMNQNEYGIQFSAGKDLITKTRIGIKNSRFDEEKISGSFIYQQLSLKNNWYNLTSRITLFEVDDFENRMYAYENDLTYSFKTSLLYRTGYKVFLLWKLKINRILKLEGKWSMTHYFNEDLISTSLYSIYRPTRHEFAFQVILKM